MNDLHHIRSGDTLRHAQSDLPSGLYRILIPKGTNLWATPSFFGLPGAGALTMSQPERDNTFCADRDRWLYLQFNFPAGKTLAVNSIIDLHDTPVVQQSTPDLDVAIRALGYANQSGLVDVLRRMANVSTDEQLVEWVLSQNGLWPSICKMVKLAEAKK